MKNSGNQWSGWYSYLSFFRHVVKLDIDYSQFRYAEELAKVGPRYVHTHFWIVSALPIYIYRDEQYRPHSASTSHIAWPDGWALWHWHGVRVPRAWIENPSSVDPKLALTWRNIEQRRALAEILGWARVLEEVQAKEIDRDVDPQIGTLIETDLPDSPNQKFLRVKCGTGREFVIPVPSEMRTARQANAWTYGLESNQLKPEVRT